MSNDEYWPRQLRRWATAEYALVAGALRTTRNETMLILTVLAVGLVVQVGSFFYAAATVRGFEDSYFLLFFAFMFMSQGLAVGMVFAQQERTYELCRIVRAEVDEVVTEFAHDPISARRFLLAIEYLNENPEDDREVRS